MRKNLSDILACPVCKGGLTLHAAELNGDEVLSGTLDCGACGESFPILDGVPNLLPPQYRDKPVSTLPGAN